MRVGGAPKVKGGARGSAGGSSKPSSNAQGGGEWKMPSAKEGRQ